MEQNRRYLNTTKQENLSPIHSFVKRQQSNIWTLVRRWHPVLQWDICSACSQRKCQEWGHKQSAADAGGGAVFLHTPLQDSRASSCVVSMSLHACVRVCRFRVPFLTRWPVFGVSAGTKRTLERWEATTSTGPSSLTSILLSEKWDDTFIPFCVDGNLSSTSLHLPSFNCVCRCW